MDLKHKLKDLLISEFAYDLIKYEDEGESKVNNLTNIIVQLFNSHIVKQQRKTLIKLAKYMEEDKMYARHDEANVDDFLDNYLI